MRTPDHRGLVERELLASALYLDLVILAALVAVPEDRLPPDHTLVWMILGTAVGLIAAHWVAFRLAAHIMAEDGRWSPSAAQEGAAQLAGGLSVAVLAAAPFVFLDGATALSTALLVLAALPAVAGSLIARLRGKTWPVALTAGVGALAVALVVVALKNNLGK